MSRNERFNTPGEILRRYPDAASEQCGAGPVIMVNNGKRIVDDSEAHIGVIGGTGMGKSQCCVLPYVMEIANKGESLVCVDPKGEVYRETGAAFEGRGYQLYCIDLRRPRQSPSTWNPFMAPFTLFHSGDPDASDLACSMICEFWNGVYPHASGTDPFWPESSANLGKALTYALLEHGDPQYMNISCVSHLMQTAESKEGFMSSFAAKKLYEALPPQSLARSTLASYATAATDTRASIESVACSGIEVFSRSKGIMQLLSGNSLDILSLDLNKPLALFIITPDETSVYSPLAGLLIRQLMQHLIASAENNGGRLGVRVNVILEELGNMGSALRDLPCWMSAARSRGIRMLLILQSLTQLTSIFGSDAMETINSCIGVNLCFASNNWETLNQWSEQCGQRQVMVGGQLRSEPIITAAQLAAMPVGCMLVRCHNREKFITRIPLFYQLYDHSQWRLPTPAAPRPDRELPMLGYKQLIDALTEKQEPKHDRDMQSIMDMIDRRMADICRQEEIEQHASVASSEADEEPDCSFPPAELTFDLSDDPAPDLFNDPSDALASYEQDDELESDEPDDEPSDPHDIFSPVHPLDDPAPICTLHILDTGSDFVRIARIIRDHLPHIPFIEISRGLHNLPWTIPMSSKIAALHLRHLINDTSGLATVNFLP